MKFEELLNLLGIQVTRFMPTKELIDTRQELADILRRMDVEINVRRDFNPNTYGKRRRDRMANNSNLRSGDNSNQSQRGNQNTS